MLIAFRAVALDRGLVPEPEVISVRADPNGLAHDAANDALYVADGRTGAILRVQGDTSRRVAKIDSGGVVAADRIAGMALAPDGTLYVARLGYGRAGAVFRIDLDGTVEPIAALAASEWRLGVAYDARTHALYTTQFKRDLVGPFDGAVVRIDLATGKVATVVDQLKKPVGVVVVGDGLVVTDARTEEVWYVDGAGRRERLAADLGRPDSVAAVGDGSVLVTTYDLAAKCGAVVQLWLDGRRRTIVTGPFQPRGIATDGVRAFVAVRRASRVLVVPMAGAGRAA